MERLTKRSGNCTAIYNAPSGDPVKWENNRHEVLQKLAEYEDLEKQGKLLKLPCAVGDTVYEIDEFENEITERKVHSIEIEDFGVTIMVSEPDGCSPYTGRCIEDFSETVFLTREEAEAALKEL